MDGDAAMSEGHEHSYPAPESAASTPYPALGGHGSNARPISDLEPTGSPTSTTNSTLGPLPQTAGGHLTLAQYFGIGTKSTQALQGPSSSARIDRNEDARDDGEEIQYEPVDDEDEDDATEDGEDGQAGSTQAASSQPSAPLPRVQDYWTTLPGVHHLPENDFLEARSRKAWEPSTAPQATTEPRAEDSTRGRPRGRGRGRGRRGWKWALKGTQHESMFDAPMISNEASGTKRRRRGDKTGEKRSRGRGRGRPRKDREPARADPGEGFKALQAKATMAFLDNDLDGALQYSLQAVTVNPEVPAAHYLIDQILTSQGRHEEALQSHWLAVVTSRDASAWMAHGERLLELAGDHKSENDYDAAFRCFSEALVLDKHNLDIRRRKIDLFIEMKLYKSAFKECKAYLKLQPKDTDMLWKFAEVQKLAQELKDTRAQRDERTARVVEAYKAAFHEWRGEPAFGDVDLQWAHLDMYIGLLEENGMPPLDCIRELKQIARWFLGRAHEIFWESLDDDREFDLTPERRVGTSFWVNRMFTLDEPRYGNGLPIWLRAKLLSFRARMGPQYREEALRHLDVLLLQPGAAEDSPETFMLTAERLYAIYWYQDAAKLYEAAKSQDHLEANRFFVGMGRCYRRLERYEKAEIAFKTAISAEPDQLDARVELARLYKDQQRQQEAAGVARDISRIGRENIHRSERAFLAEKLAKRPLVPLPPRPADQLPAWQASGESSRTSTIFHHLSGQDSGLDRSENFPSAGNQANDDEGSDADETESIPASTGQGPALMPKKRPGRVAQREVLQQLRDQQTRIQKSHAVVKKLWPCLSAESDVDETLIEQWMQQAAVLAKEFTSMKVFYPHQKSDRFVGLLAGKNTKTREVIQEMEDLTRNIGAVSREDSVDAAEEAPSTEDKTSGDFHDISFQEWHHILADLALQYARFADQDKCNEIIDALTRANVFRHDFALYNTTLALSIYCAIVFNDRQRFLEVSRQYLYQSDYRSGMAYQVYAAVGSIGYGESPFDNEASKMQQWTSLKIKAHDMLIMDDEMREKWEWGVADTMGRDPRHKRLGKVNDGLIPGLLATYAHITTSKRRVHSATALAYLFRALALQPDDVVVNLSIAVNYLVEASRKVDDPGQVRSRTVQQGLGFFYRYYNARVATGSKCYLQEAEYNAARIWQLLGWTHWASSGYSKVLKLSPDVNEEAEAEGDDVQDFAREAAFALQKIFVATGNEDAARAVGQEWLVM